MVQRENNIYYWIDGSTTDPAGRPLGKGEIITDPQFVSFPDDLHLKKSSPAINIGAFEFH